MDPHLEHVSGCIIGDQYLTGQLHYDGRPQGDKFHGHTDAEMVILAGREKQRLLADLGTESFARIWPLPIWEVRIRG